MKKKIIDNLSDKNLINKEILIKGIKKYILRYCLGDYKNRNNLFDKLKKIFEDIFERSDIWGDKIFNDKRFNEESNRLILINKEGNCILNYIYNILFSEEEEEEYEQNEFEEIKYPEDEDEYY